MAGGIQSWFCARYPYRLHVRVKGRTRRGAAMLPVRCEVDFGKTLSDVGQSGDAFDAESIVVIGHDSQGRPVIYDPEKEGDRRYVVPHRFDRAYDGYALPIFNPSSGKGTLAWLMKDETVRVFGIYFDRKRPGNPRRPLDQKHQPLIGDVEKIRVGRPGPAVFTIRAHAPLFTDLDGDGRQEMLMTTQCWRYRGEGILCFKDVGKDRTRPVYREVGLLRDEDDRIISYQPVQLHTCGIGDLNGDGREDILGIPFDSNLRRWYRVARHFVWYENIGERGRWKFRYRGPLRGRDGKPLALGDAGRRVHPRPVLGGLQFVDLDHDGRDEILCVSQQRIRLITNDGGGFEIVPLLDENGNEIGTDHPRGNEVGFQAACLTDLDGDGKHDLVLVNADNQSYPERKGRRERQGLFTDSSLIWYRNVGSRRKPRFRFEGLLTVDGLAGRSLPPGDSRGAFIFGIARAPGDGDLLVNPTEACVPYVYRYSILRRRGRGELRGNGRLRGYSALDCQQCNAVLADFDGDGRLEMLCGHMSGRLQYLRNIGTRLDPRFSRPVWLRDEANRIIRVCESTDPSGQFVTNECRAFPHDFHGDGRPDILWGSGYGRVYYLENLGPGKDGVPDSRTTAP